ncbi:MAG TPA: ribonuclease HI family protein [Actinomycetota bacterium]|nr:ribonuclease HI family protein [Actinomycetota bacterium]
MRILPPHRDRALIVSTDGAARGNPGPAGIGVAVEDLAGRVVGELGEGIGVATNNVAEYRAALRGLELAKDLGAKSVLLRSDSRLLIEQLAGRFRVKNPTLIQLHQQVRRLLPSFESVSFEHIPRELNRRADRLANQGVDEWLAGPGASYSRPGPAPNLFDEPE